MEYTTLDQIITKCAEIKNKKVKDILTTQNVLESRDQTQLENLIKKEVFNIKLQKNNPNNFEKLGIQLKVTGLIKYKKPDNEGRKYKAKEIISLGTISNQVILDEPNFEKSTLYNQMQKTLYVFYEYRYDKPMSEWKIIDFKYVELDASTNIKTLVNDYELIFAKIKKGKSEDLTHSLTEELSITIPKTTQPNLEGSAQSWEFLLKPNYVNKIFYSKSVKVNDADVMFSIVNKIQPFHGLTIGEIYKEMNLPIPEAKNQKDAIINKLLNTKSYDEIPNIKPSVFKIRNIELKNNGKLKDEIALMNVNDSEFLNDVPFNESELYTFLISYKFLFIVWQKRGEESVFKDVMLFQFDNKLITKAQFVYNDTKEKFLTGMELERVGDRTMSNLIHKSSNMGILLRPHGQNSKDTMTTPFGQVITKQQYWLNSNEVERVIKIK